MPDWTDKQKKAITLRNRNILVSAAAGSGKTAVLVERIVDIISNNKIDIDHLLIVTFTNAAAAEMRERIGEAIEKKLAKQSQSDNKHLQRQQTLIHNAQITTIHSFCLSVIRNNFNVIELDPSFRVGDETELSLLKSDTLNELLEKHYGQENESFYDFIESYSTGKTDEAIEKLILQLYTFSQSHPSPKNWLNSLRKAFDVDTDEALEQEDWMNFLLNYIAEVVKEDEFMISKIIDICDEEDGPYIYLDALNKDKALIGKLKIAKSYKDYSKILLELTWTKLSSKKDINISVEKRETAKFLRTEVKQNIESIRKSYFFQPLNEIIKDIAGSKTVMNVLIDLVIEFSNAYGEIKASKNILDFNDLEHKALEILTKRNTDGQYIPSLIAEDYSRYYEEILIDEYQDSNMVQEILLNSVSKELSGRPNIFMVGDVKQSIYKFRLARPEIFMEKYQSYLSEDSENAKSQLVNLSSNFRSRPEVIDSVNFIFQQIMDIKLGGIEYNDKSALYAGMKFKEAEKKEDYSTELIVIDAPKDILDEYELDYTLRELEAKSIANRIKALIADKFQVYDKVNGYRDIKYRDIVILLRTISGWADIFENILMTEGIAAHTETATGYFSTIEIQTILSVLNIIDNPIQDIPLTAVMKSPIVGLTSQELAIVKSEFVNKDMYTSVINYIKYGSEAELRNKLSKFIQLIDSFRNCVPYTSIHDIIWIILDTTDYYNYISAMPSGAKRRANVDMLIERALQFESTSYKGLFNFIRYIDKLKEYEIDFGEASILGENENVVRIMSVHKSKGLEFPIVFVSGLGKSFNAQDYRSKIVIHSDLGIGSDYVDYKQRIKSPTLIKKIIAKKIAMESLGEELRILYVALTRAKEKLILTGAIKQFEKILSKSCEVQYISYKLPFTLLSSADTYLDWILPSLVRHSSFENILNKKNIYINKSDLKYSNTKFKIEIIDLSQFVTQELDSQINKENLKSELSTWKADTVFDKKIHDEIERRLSWNYEHSNEVNLHAKMTVTELKLLGQNIDDEQSERLMPLENNNLPKFMNGIIEDKATTRGTVIHKVLQNIDFLKIKLLKDIDTEVEYLNKIGKLNNDELKFVNTYEIYEFMLSKLAGRIKVAQTKDRLFKEKQFVMGIKARDINNDFKSDELLLVQGIIDVYFEEEDGIVLVDYKTDKVQSSSTLIERYRTQLDYYQKAIEQITDKKVKQKIIYSFVLGKEILL